MNAFEFRCYRAILGVHWTEHRTNDSAAKVGVNPGSLLRKIKKAEAQVLRAYSEARVSGRCNDRRTYGDILRSVTSWM